MRNEKKFLLFNVVSKPLPHYFNSTIYSQFPSFPFHTTKPYMNVHPNFRVDKCREERVTLEEEKKAKKTDVIRKKGRNRKKKWSEKDIEEKLSVCLQLSKIYHKLMQV